MSKKQEELVTKYAVEYEDRYWVVYICNPGSEVFKPVLSPTKKYNHDRYGESTEGFFPVRTFKSESEAIEWAQENLGATAPRVSRHKPRSLFARWFGHAPMEQQASLR